MDALPEEVRTETQPAQRFNLYKQAEQMILDDAPWMPLWYSRQRHLLIKPNGKDYLLTPLIIPKLRHVHFTGE